LVELQRRLRITTLYVTHDQEEAVEMAHRMAVLHNGEAHQIGTPREVMDQPATDFVELFLERTRRMGLVPGREDETDAPQQKGLSDL
jgi:ABC-type sugar transport system ATPase subunit